MKERPQCNFEEEHWAYYPIFLFFLLQIKNIEKCHHNFFGKLIYRDKLEFLKTHIILSIIKIHHYSVKLKLYVGNIANKPALREKES